jgi:hypothetical protein
MWPILVESACANDFDLTFFKISRINALRIVGYGGFLLFVGAHGNDGSLWQLR